MSIFDDAHPLECLSRDYSGNYILARSPAPDADMEVVTPRQAAHVLRRRGCPEDLIAKIMSETTPAVIMC